MPHGIRAALFDLDGTLFDSEVLTDRAIAEELLARGVPGARLPPAETQGRTWHDIADALRDRHPDAGADLAPALEARWIALAGDGVPPIPGAGEALAEAGRVLGVAVVSSSPRRVIDAFLARLPAGATATVRVGAGDVPRAKPHPDGFLAAAARLGVSPGDCVVFEDSGAGLEAARAAGMAAVAVLHSCAEPARCRALARRAVHDYRALPAGWFARLSRDAAALDELGA